MSELVLKSMYEPDKRKIVVTFSLKRLALDASSPCGNVGLVLSSADAHRLRDFLNKELGEQASEPTGTGRAPQLLLAWQSMTDGLRYAVDVASETDATSKAAALKRSDPETPIRLALIIKEFVQPNPSYEWKDL